MSFPNMKSAPPTLAAPPNPYAYKRYFNKLAQDLLVLVWKARARIRVWDYAPSATEWSFAFVPGIHLARGLDSAYKYRLALCWGIWGIDIGLVPPKRVVIHDGKGFKRLKPDGTLGEVVDIAPFTADYDPNEANERP